MGLKRFLFTFLLFSCSFIFSQSEKHTPWIIKSAQNLNDPFTSHELVLINSAFDSETLKRINKINALKKYVKDILRNKGLFYLENSLFKAISKKPKGHDFNISRSGINISSDRHMSVTGG